MGKVDFTRRFNVGSTETLPEKAKSRIELQVVRMLCFLQGSFRFYPILNKLMPTAGEKFMSLKNKI